MSWNPELKTRAFTSEEVSSMLEAAEKLRSHRPQSPASDANERTQAILRALEAHERAHSLPGAGSRLASKMRASVARFCSEQIHAGLVAKTLHSTYVKNLLGDGHERLVQSVMGRDAMQGWAETQWMPQAARRNCQLAQMAGTHADPKLLQHCFEHRADRELWYPSDEHVHAAVLRELLKGLAKGHADDTDGQRALACARLLIGDTSRADASDAELPEDLFRVMLEHGNTPAHEEIGVDILLEHFAAGLPDPIGFCPLENGEVEPMLQAAIAAGARTLMTAMLVHAQAQGYDMGPEVDSAEAALRERPSAFPADSPQHPTRMLAAARKLVQRLADSAPPI